MAMGILVVLTVFTLWVVAIGLSHLVWLAYVELAGFSYYMAVAAFLLIRRYIKDINAVNKT